MTVVVGENLDRLASVEMRRQDEPYRGVAGPIAGLIRVALGEPSSTAAARLLLGAAPGDHVLMCNSDWGPMPSRLLRPCSSVIHVRWSRTSC